jgi:ubiquinone/menaquinone biosynthesis C-methylase UbiE
MTTTLLYDRRVTARTKDLAFAHRAFVIPAAYENGRAGYPPEAVDCLTSELAIHAGCHVVDLAAGTGKLTRLLVAAGAKVTAVEPVAEMRARLGQIDGVTPMGGIAEALPLRCGSVDAITVAQAFHWFDPEVALPEIHRVLGAGGALGLIWNQADQSVPWVARVNALRSVAPGGDGLEELRRRGKRAVSLAVSEVRERLGRSRATPARDPSWLVRSRQAFALPVATSLFTPLQRSSFAHAVEMDADRLVDWARSFSSFARLSPAEQEGVAVGVRDLASRELPERFAFPYRTEVFWCLRKQEAAR